MADVATWSGDVPAGALRHARSVLRGQASLSGDDLAAWRAGNNNGEGYAVGEGGDTPEQGARSEGYEVLEVDEEGRVVARSKSGRRIVVCDASGPWAVAIGGERDKG